jgi:hypothetical protein
MLAASTANEAKGKVGLTAYRKQGRRLKPISHFRTLRVAASYLLHHGNAYFGAHMVMASTIRVKRY